MLSCVPAEDSFLEISPIPSQQKRRSWQSTILAKAALHNPVAKTLPRPDLGSHKSTTNNATCPRYPAVRSELEHCEPLPLRVPSALSRPPRPSAVQSVSNKALLSKILFSRFSLVLKAPDRVTRPPAHPPRNVSPPPVGGGAGSGARPASTPPHPSNGGGGG